MHLKGVYRKNLAVFMSFLVISLSFFVGSASAQNTPTFQPELQIIEAKGTNGVTGFKKVDDEVTVVARLKSSEQPTVYQVRFNGFPADSCTKSGDDTYDCTIVFDKILNQVSVIYYNSQQKPVAQDSRSITVDDISPEVSEMNWIESEKKLCFKVRDTSRDQGKCSGINDISLTFGGVLLPVQPKIDSATACTMTGCFDLTKGKAEEREGNLVVRVTDMLDNYHASSGVPALIDNKAPQILDLELIAPAFVNTAQSYSTEMKVTFSDMALIPKENVEANVWELVRDAIPSDQQYRYTSVKPSACTLTEQGDASECIWSMPVIVSSTSDRTIRFRIDDGNGNIAEISHTQSFQTDNEAPYVLNLTSNFPYYERGRLVNYIGPSGNSFKLSLYESGSGLANSNIFLDLSSVVAGQRRDRANSCAPSESDNDTWVCTWNSVTPNRKLEAGTEYIISTTTSFDDASNLMNDNAFRIIYDDTEPEILETDYYTHSFRECPTSSDLVTVRALTKDVSPVSAIKVVGSRIVGKSISSSPSLYTYTGSCKKQDCGLDPNSKEQCYLCEANISADSFSSAAHYETVQITVMDPANNTATDELSFNVCEINKNETPNCVSIMKGEMIPPVVDWRAASHKPFPLYIEIRPLATDSSCEVLDTFLSARACSGEFPVAESEILNPKTASPILSMWVGGSGAEPSPGKNAIVYCGGKQISLFKTVDEDKQRLRTKEELELFCGDSTMTYKPVITCGIGFTVRQGMTYFEKSEIDEVNITLPLSGMKLGWFDESVEELKAEISKDIRSTEDKMSGLAKIFGDYIRPACMAVQYAMLMVAISTILAVSFFIVLGVVEKALEGLGYKTAAQGVSSLISGATSLMESAFKGTSYIWNYAPTESGDLWHLTGWLIRVLCLIVSCQLCTLGEGSGATQPSGFFEAMGIMANIVGSLQLAQASETTGTSVTEELDSLSDLGNVNYGVSGAPWQNPTTGMPNNEWINGAMDKVMQHYAASLTMHFASGLISTGLHLGDVGERTTNLPSHLMQEDTASSLNISFDDPINLNPYRSREVAEGCFCFPGQIAAELKRKQILCRAWRCVDDLGRYGTLPANVCLEVKAVRECLYYHGAIVELGGVSQIFLIMQAVVAGALKLAFPPSYLVATAVKWLAGKLLDWVPSTELGSILTDWISAPAIGDYTKYAAILMMDYGQLVNAQESNVVDQIRSTEDEACRGVVYD